MHRPEAWTGQLSIAPIMFVASNPSFDKKENFPNWDSNVWDESSISDFGANRFSNKTDRKYGATDVGGKVGPDRTVGLTGTVSKSVSHWKWVRKYVAMVLGKDISETSAVTDYVMTELVHCKSPKEQGVWSQSLSTCSSKYFERILELSPAKLIFIAGVKSAKSFAETYPQLVPNNWGAWSNSLKGKGSWPATKVSLAEMVKNDKWGLEIQMQNSFETELGGQKRTFIYIARPGGGGGLYAPWVHEKLLHPELIKHWRSKLGQKPLNSYLYEKLSLDQWKEQKNVNSETSFEDHGYKALKNIFEDVYLNSEPRIHLRTGFARHEWSSALNKLYKSFQIANQLCDLQRGSMDFEGNDLEFYLDSNTNNSLVFAGGNLALHLSEDLSYVLSLFTLTNSDSNLNFDPILDEMYEYFKKCCFYAPPGDHINYFESALFKAAETSDEWELTLTLDAIQSKGMNTILSQSCELILMDLSRHFEVIDHSPKKVKAIRFFDKQVVIAFIEDEWPKFYVGDHFPVELNKYDEKYVYGEIYRNDKVQPHTIDEWEAILIPGNVLNLGYRFYSSMEEAEDNEGAFLNSLQAEIDE